MIGINKYAFLLQNFIDIVDTFWTQSERFGTEIFTETVTKVDFSSRPFKLFMDLRTVLADAVIISTRAVVKRLSFVGSGEGAGGFWNRGISSCAVCDGAALIFKNKPLVVIGGGDSAMEKVYIIHRCDTFRASKIMQQRALSKPKIKLIWNSVVEAYGDENGKGVLGGLKVKNVIVSGDVSDLKISGLFFAIGHEPATKFLDGQLELDEDGYVVTKPGTTKTSVLLYEALSSSEVLTLEIYAYFEWANLSISSINLFVLISILGLFELLLDAPAPMPKDTNLDVIRVLAEVKEHFLVVFYMISYLQDMYDCSIEQAVGGVFYKSSELISPYNNLLSCRWHEQQKKLTKSHQAVIQLAAKGKVQVHERMNNTINPTIGRRTFNQ
ncbi:hypothetical protein HID58_001010 [Brassica napus]|uniref:FAD/NAD(P)-binding domain-containing protein n=1 Tax=Brassica napus TaxID=3708 RepID=A0ABQ8EIT0_BRANA|nr:hypothetical protein HID58_001010 [Brassica napus]